MFNLIMPCLKKCATKFKIATENQGDIFTITFRGQKEDIAKLDKKINALHVLIGDCCDKDGSCC